MTPRSVALQGLGFGALLVALQGFGDASVLPPPVPPIASSTHVGPRHLPPRVIPIDARLYPDLDEDELIVVIAMAAIESGLLDF